MQNMLPHSLEKLWL